MKPNALIDFVHYEKDFRYHDSIASEYDKVVVEPRRFRNDKLFARCSKFVPGGDLMLDLGCGTGHASLRFARKFKKVLAVDHSVGMQEIAKRNLSEAGIHNVDLVNANVLSYVGSLEPSSADTVCCIGFLHHLRPADHPLLLQAIGTVLRPGALLLVSEPLSIRNPTPALIAYWNARSIAARQAYTSNAPEADEIFLDERTFLQQLEQASFSVARTFHHWEIFPHAEHPGPLESVWIDLLNFVYAANGNVLTVIATKSR